jgi:hypothetical protein
VAFFEKLSLLFLRIGTSWTLHDDFAKLFPDCRELQTFLCEYLIVLVDLCTKMVQFSHQSLASHLKSCFASSFESEFGPFQDKLDQWGA